MLENVRKLAIKWGGKSGENGNFETERVELTRSRFGVPRQLAHGNQKKNTQCWNYAIKSVT